MPGWKVCFLVASALNHGEDLGVPGKLALAHEAASSQKGDLHEIAAAL